ncbi:cation diffusion facilitator CzcD-associated flavoprotein CzcO [Paenibacillus mucilaginosus]
MTKEIIYDSVVIGGGQSGLASAWFLQQEGLDFVVLEQSGNLGSWAHYYDSLQLFSPARYSSLPGYPFSGDPEKYPARDERISPTLWQGPGFTIMPS